MAIPHILPGFHNATQPGGHEVVIPFLRFREISSRLPSGPPGTCLLAQVERADLSPRHTRWLLRKILPSFDLLGTVPADVELFLLNCTDGSTPPLPYHGSNLSRLPAQVKGELFFGTGTWAGRLWGTVREQPPTPFASLARLHLPGAGMVGWDLRSPSTVLVWPPQIDDASVSADGAGVWGETAGSKGPLERLRATRLHFTGEEPALSWWSGWGEVAGALASSASPPLASHSATSVTTQAGARAALASDVLIDLQQPESIRLALAVAATAYHKVQLSISHPAGAGLYSSGSAVMDVRLMVPGSWCLLCLGGIADWKQTLQTLQKGQRKEPDRAQLVTEPVLPRESCLNHLATGIGQGLLLGLFQGTVVESQWRRVTVSPTGECRVETPLLRAWEMECPLCAKAGEGDRGTGLGTGTP